MASSLAVHAYDTLSIARGLERDYAFGKKQAEGIARTIHEHLVANVATKDDLEHLRVELTGKIAEVRVELTGKIAEVHSELTGKIAEVHSELGGKIAEVRVEIAEARGEIAEARGELAEVRGELGSKIAEVRGELGSKIAEVRGEIVALNGRVDRLEGRIDNLGKALTFRLGAMIATGIGLLAALQAVIG